MEFKRVKKIISGQPARDKIKQGIDLVADSVKITLGPKGRNVALNQIGPLPTRVINDGVTIAKEVKSEDPYVQSGVEMVQEICEKTNNNAGDGTTQTALLASVIINEGQRKLNSFWGNNNPMDLKRILNEDLDGLLSYLSTISTKIENVEQIRSLATISGNNDQEIGDAIAEVIEKVGMNASILIEKGNEETIKTETIKGIYFDKGFRAPAFINQFNKGTAEYKEPSIFIVDEDLRWDDDIIEFFQAIAKYNESAEKQMKNIVIIAREIEGEAFTSLALNHKAKYENPDTAIDINILAIEAPYVGPDREDFMNDLAIYTGGKVTKKLREAVPAEIVGSCDRLVSTSKVTTIIGGAGKQEDVDKKIEEIKNLISQTQAVEKTTREKLEKRRDTLESGVGVIYAGGKTEIEIKDRYLRLEDAVRASKSAVKEGFVPGGGYTYLLMSKKAKTGILRNALTCVTKQIALNAGVDADSVVSRCLAYGEGYNAKTGEYGSMIIDGVIDATLVVKNALQNAVSLSCSFLTTEVLICETEEPREFNFK